MLADANKSVDFWKAEAIQATQLLRGMHDKYHIKSCCCYIADFLCGPVATRSQNSGEVKS
jgi:hypothetical protein